MRAPPGSLDAQLFDISEAVKKRRKERNQQPMDARALKEYARLLLKVHGLVKPPSPPHYLHWWCNAANIDIIVSCVTKSNATKSMMIHMLDVVSSIEDELGRNLVPIRRQLRMEYTSEPKKATSYKTWDELQHIKWTVAAPILESKHASYTLHMKALCFAIYTSIDPPRNELCNVIVDEYGMGDLWYDESTFDPLWGVLTLREWTKFTDSPPVGWDLENSQIHMLMRASLKKFPRKYLLAKGVGAPFLESTLRYALEYFDTSVRLLRQARVDHFNRCPTSTIAGRLTLANTMNDQKAKQKLERITCGKQQ